ncbi:MAG: amidohydrolase [Clostridiales bacterium]|nr:amidohydrolase [Clostridiales bacterium]
MIEDGVISSLKNQAKNLSDQIINWRRLFHSMPELKMETPLTEQAIIKELEKLGVSEIRSGVGGHGVVAVIRGNACDETIAIRSDCDGLPIKEETSLPFRSTNGNMHACGHDAHVATALGAVKLIIDNKRYLNCNVKFIFQPYEEGDGGAKLMLADGVLENPKVDEIIAMHVNVDPCKDYVLGDVLISNKPTSAGIYAYEATFMGKQSHVCNSHTAINPVHCACTAVSEIAKISKLNSEVVNAVTIINGGVRNNVIPETCAISGSIRSFNDVLHKQTIDKVNSILEEVAKDFDCKLNVKTTIDLMPMKIDLGVYERFENVVNAMYPSRNAIQLKERDLIGEDFARFSHKVPAMHFFFHVKKRGESYPLHSPKFDIDDSVLYKASAILAGFTLLR